MARDIEKKDELFALAKKTPLTRSAVEELAGRASSAALRLHAIASLTEAGSHAATVLAFASIAKGDKLAAAFVRGLLAEVESFEHVGPLLVAADDIVEAAAGFLEDRRGTWEREVIALLVAADALKDSVAPKALISRARYLSRHDLGADSAVILGAAAARLGDADLASLAAPQIAKAKRHKRVIEETLATTRTPPLELLSESAQRVTAGFTVKRDAPSVGRNDPCPCGSGKKYKKCHALESSDAGWQPPAIDPTVLGPDQTANMRASELAQLDTSRLPKAAWIEAFKRSVDYRQWDLVARMIGEAKTERPSERDALVLEALLGAFDAGESAAAARFHAMLPPDLAEDRAFELDCVSKPTDLLDRIEAEARLALREDADGARGMLLASTLLRHLPALGVYVARGALHDGRIRDSEALLQRIEDARDRLLVSPFEPWWDVYDALVDEGGERRDQRKADAKREKLKEDLRRARAASRKTAAEVDKLQKRIDELDSTMATRAQLPKAAGQAQPKLSVDTDLADERRRLKTKIDELQRIIGEGQEERRDLRKQLAEKTEDTDVPAKREGAPAEAEEEPHGMHEDEDVEAPRAVLVPRFGDRAARAVEGLAAPSADAILQVVASLAAGKPNAWHGVKQLTKVRGVLSARAGIHHRVLFRIDASALDVVDVLHRKDLEQVVARLARAGDARRS